MNTSESESPPLQKVQLYCKIYGTLTILPRLYFKHSFKATIKEVTPNISDVQLDLAI